MKNKLLPPQVSIPLHFLIQLCREYDGSIFCKNICLSWDIMPDATGYYEGNVPLNTLIELLLASVALIHQ